MSEGDKFGEYIHVDSPHDPENEFTYDGMGAIMDEWVAKQRDIQKQRTDTQCQVRFTPKGEWTDATFREVIGGWDNPTAYKVDIDGEPHEVSVPKPITTE